MYEELVAALNAADKRPCSAMECPGSGECPDVGCLFREAADAIVMLQNEVKRMSSTFVIPEEKAITVCGYPVGELTAFAELCRRHEITEPELHNFCKNAVAGFEAGKNDWEITYKNMAERLGFCMPPKEETE